MTVIPTPGLPAVPTEYTQRALAVMVQVRELGRTVEGFAFAPQGRRLAIGTVASLPEEFLQHAAAALDLHPALGAGFNLTAVEVREALSFKREFTNAANETRLVAKGMEDTVAERIAHVGDKCLSFYNAAKRATPRDSVENLVPHLEAMKQALNRGRKKKKLAPEPAKKGDAK